MTKSLAAMVVALVLAGPESSPTPAVPRLPRVQSFICYYGTGQVEELERYDLAIIETRHHRPADIHRMRSTGTIVLGYLSLGEILEEPDGAGKGAREDPRDPALGPYYLDGDGDGRPDRNPGWQGLYVDARSPVWQARVLDRLIPALLEDAGVDGLFLDTLDTVEAYPATRPGMIELVRRIRQNHPARPILANRGFEMAEELAPLVDGFLFEEFTTRYDPELGVSTVHPPADLEWVDGVLARLRRAAGSHPLQVLLLDYAARADAEPARRAIARARRVGLPWSISVGSLDRLPLSGGPGALRPATPRPVTPRPVTPRPAGPVLPDEDP